MRRLQIDGRQKVTGCSLGLQRFLGTIGYKTSLLGWGGCLILENAEEGVY